MMRAMQYVYTFNGAEYFLTAKQAEEVDATSEATPDDAIFNVWFTEYVSANNINSRREKKHASYWSRVPDSKDSKAKMVAVQQAATTLVRVVNPNITKSKVSFDDNRKTSIYSVKDESILMPSWPALKSESIHEAIDNTAGFAIHEAYHSKFSRNVFGLPRPFGNTYLGNSIANYIEDCRIDALGRIENPGFDDYEQTKLDRLYELTNDYKLPVAWPTDSMEAQLNALLSNHQYGDRRVGSPGDTEYAHKIAEAVKVAQDYAALGSAASTIDVERAVYAIEKMLDAANDGVPGNTIVGCDMRAGDLADIETLNDIESEEIAELAAQDMEYFKDGKPNPDAKGHDMVAPVSLTVLRPPNDKYDREKIRTPPGDVLKADAHLRLRKTLARKDERFNTSGDLDEDELYRLLQGDTRVFKDNTEEVEEEAAVYFLVDISGSMRGSIGYSHIPPDSGILPDKIQVAAEMAWLIAHSMNKRPHVKVKVYAHTGDVGSDFSIGAVGAAVVYRVFEPGDPITRLNMLLNLPNGENYDGFAIGYVGKQIMNDEATKKYLIVLADGQPVGRGYGGRSAEDHVRAQTDMLMKKGINVMQIAIGNGISRKSQERMFKHYVPFTDTTTTIKQLAKLLDKVR